MLRLDSRMIGGIARLDARRRRGDHRRDRGIEIEIIFEIIFRITSLRHADVRPTSAHARLE